MLIPLSVGSSSSNKFVEVDEEDYQKFHRLRWSYRADTDKQNGCAVRNAPNHEGINRLSYLHREILNAPDDMEVVFLNHDKLDCRRENLKLVPKNQANRYQKPRKDSKTGAKGVKFNEKSGTYYASIVRFGRSQHLGSYPTKEAAMEARRAAEEQLTHPGAVWEGAPRPIENAGDEPPESSRHDPDKQAGVEPSTEHKARKS